MISWFTQAFAFHKCNLCRYSAAVIARRQLAVGSAVLREAPFAPHPDATVAAMLQGIRAMGVRNALGWSEKTETWRQRVLWLRRVVSTTDDDENDELFPDLSDAFLEDTLEEWLAPLLPGGAVHAASFINPCWSL